MRSDREARAAPDPVRLLRSRSRLTGAGTVAVSAVLVGFLGGGALGAALGGLVFGLGAYALSRS